MLFIPSLYSFAAFYVSNHKIMSEVQTYSKGSKKIVLIDMIHIGPRKFYKNVRKKLKEFKKDRAVVLQEGVHVCHKKGDELYVPTKSADFNKLEELYLSRNTLDQKLANKKLESSGFQRVICIRDSSDKSNILDRFLSRFSFYGLMAGVGLVRSQGSMKIYPKNIALENGDIASSSFIHPIMKALSGSIVECMLKLETEDNCIAFKLWLATDNGKKIVDDFIINTRNNILVEKALLVLGEKTPSKENYNFLMKNIDQDVVILPWGADHMSEELAQTLVDAGFQKEGTTKQGVVYSSCNKLQSNLILRLIFAGNKEIKNKCR